MQSSSCPAAHRHPLQRHHLLLSAAAPQLQLQMHQLLLLQMRLHHNMQAEASARAAVSRRQPASWMGRGWM